MLHLVGVHLLEQLDSTIAVTENECRSQGCVAQGCVAHGGSAVIHAFIIMCAMVFSGFKSPTYPIVIQVRIGEGTCGWVPARSEENEVVPENTTARLKVKSAGTQLVVHVCSSKSRSCFL